MSNVQVEVKNYVAVVTLNRPPVNATSRAVREELIRIFDALPDRDDVRVVVLNGAGKPWPPFICIYVHVYSPHLLWRYARIRQHTSALCPHTSAYVSAMFACVSIRQRCARICQHTSAYMSHLL